MFLAIITIHPLPGDESKIIDILDSMRRLVPTLPDCQGCQLSLEAGGGESICYIERWRTRAALEKYLRSPLYHRVLEAMELSRTPPNVEFFEGELVGGLNFVETVRLSNASAYQSEGTGCG